jgi:hypothetical protein
MAGLITPSSGATSETETPAETLICETTWNEMDLLPVSPVKSVKSLTELIKLRTNAERNKGNKDERKDTAAACRSVEGQIRVQTDRKKITSRKGS